jgi:hypothetical protein
VSDLLKEAYADGREGQQNRSAIGWRSVRNGNPGGTNEEKWSLCLDGQAVNREPELGTDVMQEKKNKIHASGKDYLEAILMLQQKHGRPAPLISPAYGISKVFYL